MKDRKQQEPCPCLSAAQPLRQVHLRHGEAELRGHLLPTAGGAEHHVQAHGEAQLRERCRGHPGSEGQVSRASTSPGQAGEGFRELQLGGASRAKLGGAAVEAWLDGTSQLGPGGICPGLWVGSTRSAWGMAQWEPWPWPRPPFLASFLLSVQGWVASVFKSGLGAPSLLPRWLQPSWAAQPDLSILSLCPASSTPSSGTRRCWSSRPPRSVTW